MNTDCIFCKIVANEVPSSKVFENDAFIAVLDLFPNTKGQTVLISKKHLPSDIFKTDFEFVHKGIDAAKEVVAKLEAALSPSRVALMTEGVFVDHLHIKLFPLYNVEKFTGDLGDPAAFFEEFPGYVNSKGGPQWSREDLERLAGLINEGRR